MCTGYCGQVSGSVAISRASTQPAPRQGATNDHVGLQHRMHLMPEARRHAARRRSSASLEEGYNTAPSSTGKRTGGRAQTMACFSKARCIKTGGKGTKLQSGAQVTRDNGQVTPGVVSRQQAPVPDSGHPGAVKSESKPRGHERRSHVRNPPPPPLGRTGSLAPESLNR